MPEANPPASGADERDRTVIPLVEEVATVGTRQVATGKVVVRTVVETEERLLREALREESAEVERVPIDRVVDVAPEMRIEGDVTIVPVLEERLVVWKQLVLVEEVHIRRRPSVETVEVPVQLHRQRAVIEHLDADGNAVADPT